MITPADSTSAPAQYDAVPVTMQNIQAPQADLSAAVSNSMSEALSRQPQSQAILMSDEGTAGFDIMGGYTGSWGNVPEPDVAGP